MKYELLLLFLLLMAWIGFVLRGKRIGKLEKLKNLERSLHKKKDLLIEQQKQKINTLKSQKRDLEIKISDIKKKRR